MVSALILIGAPGAGKSSVLEALATLHDIEEVDHGAIEAEQLSLGRPLLPASVWIPALEGVLSLQRQAGRRTFLIGATVEDAEDLEGLRRAVAAETLLVVCLRASSEVVAARIDAREPDRWPGKAPLISRARELASSTPGLPGVDCVIDTEERTPESVAGEIFEAMRRQGMLASS